MIIGMQPYTRRLVDDELDDLFSGLAAISLDGAKGVGKTATASMRAKTVFRLDDNAVAEVVRAAPEQLSLALKPVLLDEWQRAPEVWDIVRRNVDADDTGGQFLLTGSAAPANSSTHSGAGRIVSLRMRPLSLAERGIESPTVRMRDLLTGVAPIHGTTSLGITDYVHEIVASGFPGIRNLPERARRAQLDSYINRIIEKEFAEQGLRVRRPETLRNWIAAYAAATASTASYATILDAATPGLADKPAKTTAIVYRDVLAQLWLLDPVEAWLPTRSDFTRLAQAPKHFLADPALAARLLGVEETSLLNGTRSSVLGPQEGTVVGRLFEALVALSLQAYAQQCEARLGHFRTRNGDREIDFVVSRADGATVAIEVKLARTVADSDVRHILWLKQKMGAALTDMIVVTTGDRAYRRPDGVAVVPAALLGA